MYYKIQNNPHKINYLGPDVNEVFFYLFLGHPTNNRFAGWFFPYTVLLIPYIERFSVIFSVKEDTIAIAQEYYCFVFLRLFVYASPFHTVSIRAENGLEHPG